MHWSKGSDFLSYPHPEKNRLLYIWLILNTDGIKHVLQFLSESEVKI